MELSRLYGKNNPSPQKKLVMKGLKLGKSFATLAAELRVAQATAEVYGIDCLAAGGDLDDKSMAHFLDVNKKSFGIIKDTSVVMVPYGTVSMKLILIIKSVLFLHV